MTLIHYTTIFNDIDEEKDISLENELTNWLTCNKLSMNVEFIIYHGKRKNIEYPSISIHFKKII